VEKGDEEKVKDDQFREGGALAFPGGGKSSGKREVFRRHTGGEKGKNLDTEADGRN